MFVTIQELKRFLTLQAEIAAAGGEALERFREESKKTAVQLLDMESSYLTGFLQKTSPRGRERRKPCWASRHTYRPVHRGALQEDRLKCVLFYVGTVSETLKTTIPKAVIIARYQMY